VFNAGLRKGEDLKTAFIDFISSVSQGSKAFIDTIAYSFLIPIIADISSIASGTQDLDEASILIAERLLSSGVILISSQTLSELIKKILKRLR
jgi:hypothetical protein